MIVESNKAIKGNIVSWNNEIKAVLSLISDKTNRIEGAYLAADSELDQAEREQFVLELRDTVLKAKACSAQLTDLSNWVDNTTEQYE